MSFSRSESGDAKKDAVAAAIARAAKKAQQAKRSKVPPALK